ncbi:nicotinate-nucleotide--dimethylbenzimidazole phosphoribosyltransferase [Aureivirga sp. CE67]|uniref:nicotinate-nucleotide--dimethylbenzimidazole phosphoribosyltransferase n=1 Tax=Aureivirga sp. CE67 TaxID=1788983 RepID=UPI0018CAA8A0|nr:nicotinate-nucleotide--dimethylbenzimidazole phosphoribosyltransferase [Aureivirga sp. CE67]
MNFGIEKLNTDLDKDIQHKIDTKTKPLGALGKLEDIAFKIAKIQQTLEPKIEKPAILVFAGDHGIAKENIVNPFPQEVTTQMVYNFLNKGAAINVFCEENNVDLKIVDAGVNHDFENHSELINAKIAFGTKNYQKGVAMTNEECQKAISLGSELVLKQKKEGTNTIGFGEMGIGNTSAASLIMHYVTKTSIEKCVGAGTGLPSEGILKKTNALKEVISFHGEIENPLQILQTVGGFEITMMCGAMLEAAKQKMTILIDGFICTSALLIAAKIDSNILDYCIFTHNSEEKGHEKMLAFLNQKPLLNLGLRLGEGTGAALSVPIIRTSIAFFNRMASFESAGVSEKN